MSYPPKIERNMDVVTMRLMGEPWSAIAKFHRISVATARTIVTRYHKRLHVDRAGRYGRFTGKATI